jgi:uncharacterized protein (TIGR00255 family)
MIISMTGYAARRGAGAGHVWVWDIRSVNGKGLDLRLRVPDWIEGLEPAIRADLQKSLSRGNVSLTLKVTQDDAGDATAAMQINGSVLAAGLAALWRVEQAAMAAGVILAPPTAADILAMRGVLDPASQEADTTALRTLLVADLAGLIADFAAMRRAEGAALATVIGAQIDRIADLTVAALTEAEARTGTQGDRLREALSRILGAVDGVDATRLAQELALLSVKSDVTEELDRLAAHVTAARALVADQGPVGRKLDFLMQEFMREANTLCSKAQAMALTRIGLDLKTVIDQMREQVQNVE